MLTVAGVFALILTIIFGAYWMFVVRPEEREEQALHQRLKTRGPTTLRPVVKTRERLSALGPLDTALSRSRIVREPLERLLHQSGFTINVGTLVLASVFLWLVTAVVVASLTSSGLLGLGLGAVAMCVPFGYLLHAARKRLAYLEAQFLEAADLMARALRAGHAFTTALRMVADELPAPAGPEFRLLFEQQNHGMALPDALKDFATRVPMLDARFFVTAVLTQRETGGNLAEVLDNLSSVIRERFKVKRQVRVISAHGRITGLVLGLLPPSFALLLFVLVPEHMRLLIDDPLGRNMIIAAILLQVVGLIIIRRIVAVEY